MTCWFASLDSTPCDGRLVKAHLLPKQTIRREILSARRRHQPRWPVTTMDRGFLHNVLWDPRVWVFACGGPTGIGGHHGRFDNGQLIVARESLSAELEIYAEQYGLGWLVDRRFGLQEQAA